MKNNTWVSGFIIVLVLMNVGLLFTLWYMKPPAPPQAELQGPPPGVRKLVDELHLNAAQEEKFNELRLRHETAVRTIIGEMRATKDSAIHTALIQGKMSPEAERLLRRASELQFQLDIATVQHLSALRAECTPDQQKIFDSVFHHFIAPPEAGREQHPLPPRRQ
jgi:hypothetical protein